MLMLLNRAYKELRKRSLRQLNASTIQIFLTFPPIYDTIKWVTKFENGAWRSPEARLNGVQEVAGSNPVAPILWALARVDILSAAQL